MSSDGRTLGRVEGERETNSIDGAQSMQSRMSNLLAVGLMCAVGFGALTWYYAKAIMRDGAAEHGAGASVSRVQGDLPLPGLGPLASLLPPKSESLEPAPSVPRALTEIPLAPNPPSSASAVPPPKSPSQTLAERQLSGAVFVAQSVPVSGMLPDPDPDALPGAGPRTGSGEDGRREPAARDYNDLAAMLRPTASRAVRAQMLPAQRLLLPKGAFIDCTLETAIDSALPGMTTCVTATDTFGVDGKVVLMERGTKLIGETRGQVQRGSARLFVLWTEARTPAGVIVPLDSPGTDELGRSGLSGEAHSHFWERFGAAILVSVIDGAVQAAAQSSRGGGNVVVNPSASQDVLTEILRNTISVPPTVVKRNGDAIQVLVARDVDFRSVYELRSTPRQR